MIPATREEFKQYCLRKLGAPVIKINVADQQLEDRIDEALKFYAEHHYNGTQRVYMSLELTEDHIANKEIPLPDNIIGVTRVLDMTMGQLGSNPLFNLEREAMLQNWQNQYQGGLTSYHLTRLHLETVREQLSSRPLIRFNRNGAVLHLDITRELLHPGTFIVIECHIILDGDEYPILWSERILQNYTAALIKEQWGIILSKFQNMQLIGGVQFSGDMIYSQAVEERRSIEETIIANYAPIPLDFYG